MSILYSDSFEKLSRGYIKQCVLCIFISPSLFICPSCCSLFYLLYASQFLLLSIHFHLTLLHFIGLKGKNNVCRKFEVKDRWKWNTIGFWTICTVGSRGTVTHFSHKLSKAFPIIFLIVQGFKAWSISERFDFVHFVCLFIYTCNVSSLQLWQSDSRSMHMPASLTVCIHVHACAQWRLPLLDCVRTKSSQRKERKCLCAQSCPWIFLCQVRLFQETKVK